MAGHRKFRALAQRTMSPESRARAIERAAEMVAEIEAAKRRRLLAKLGGRRRGDRHHSYVIARRLLLLSVQ